MKVCAFNGSPRPKGNTFLLLSIVLEELKKEGIGREEGVLTMKALGRNMAWLMKKLA